MLRQLPSLAMSMRRPSANCTSSCASSAGCACQGAMCQYHSLGSVMPYQPRPSSTPSTLPPAASREVTSKLRYSTRLE